MKNKISFILAILAGVILLNSCLKDDEFDNWKEDVDGSIFATVLKPQLQTLALQPVAGYVNFEFMVNIATSTPPSTDINITMAIDPTAVTAYNARTGKNYLTYPNLEIINPNITIEKGTRTAIVKCRVWGADELDACDNFIAPISISTVSGGIPISSNMKTYMLALPIANPYSGSYRAVGYRNHPTAGMQPFDYPALQLATYDCRTITKDRTGNYTGYTLNIEVTDETMDVGGRTVYKVILKINEIDDFGVYDDDGGVPMNYYDPIDRKFELFYFYQASAPRIIRETLTRN